jgi:hypothetical protein
MKKTALTFGLISGVISLRPHGRLAATRRQDRFRPQHRKTGVRVHFFHWDWPKEVHSDPGFTLGIGRKKCTLTPVSLSARVGAVTCAPLCC